MRFCLTTIEVNSETSHAYPLRLEDIMNDTTLYNSDFAQAEDPFILFKDWFEEATRRELNDPNAMALATVDKTGLPNVRMVLLKHFSHDGFVFYTNYESCKGQEILATMKASLCFHWKSLRRQVRVRGTIKKVDDIAADVYFQSRSRENQIGAWASKQSRSLENRFVLEKIFSEYTTRYAEGNIPRPPYWSGFSIQPIFIEFWCERPFRLHDRLLFTRNSVEHNRWKKETLYP